MICLESWAILIHIADFGWISQRFGVMYFPLSHAILLLSSYYLRYTVFMMIESLPTILSVTCKHTEYHHVGTSLQQAFTHSRGSPLSPEGSTGQHIFFRNAVPFKKIHSCLSSTELSAKHHAFSNNKSKSEPRVPTPSWSKEVKVKKPWI